MNRESENQFFLAKREIRRALKNPRVRCKLKHGSVRARRINGEWILFQEYTSLEVMLKRQTSEYLKVQAKLPERGHWNTEREWLAQREGFALGQMLLLAWIKDRMRQRELFGVKEFAEYFRATEPDRTRAIEELRGMKPRGKTRKPTSTAELNAVLEIRAEKRCNLTDAVHLYSVRHHFGKRDERKLYERAKPFQRDRAGGV